MSKMIVDGKFQELDENGNIKFIKHYTNNKLICVDHLHNENELKYSIYYDDENNCNKIVDSNGHVMYEMKKIDKDIHEHFDLNESNNKFSLINGEFNGQCELCYNYNNYKSWISDFLEIPLDTIENISIVKNKFLIMKNVCGINYKILINIKRNLLANFIIVNNNTNTETLLKIYNHNQNANILCEKSNYVNGKLEGEKLEFYYSSWKNTLQHYNYNNICYSYCKDFMVCKVSNYKDNKITDSKIYKINDYNKDYDYTKDETKQLIFDQKFVFYNDYTYNLYYETTFKDYYKNYLNIDEDDENSNKKLSIHSNGINNNGNCKYYDFNVINNDKILLKTINIKSQIDCNYYEFYNLDEKYKTNKNNILHYFRCNNIYKFHYNSGVVYYHYSYKEYDYVKKNYDKDNNLISSVAYKYGKVYEQLFPPPSILESTINMIKNIIS